MQSIDNIFNDSPSTKLINFHAQYMSIKAISASTIKRYLINPDSFKGFSDIFLKKPLYNVTSNDLMLGSLFHKYVLEPQDFNKHKESYLSMLSNSQRKLFNNVISHILKNKAIVSLLQKKKYVEKVFLFNINIIDSRLRNKSIPCKAMIDLFTTDGYLIDFKSTSNLYKFHYEIFKYRYDLQLAFYKTALELNGEKVKGCLIFAFEKAEPFNNHIFELSEQTLKDARDGSSTKTGFTHIKGFLPTIKEMIFNPRKSFEHTVTTI